MALARRAWPDALAALLVGAAVFAFFGHSFLNYDSFYALVWGDDLAHGRTPQYDAPVAPTPHPLATLVGLILSPLGDGAETAFLVLVVIAIGALVVGIFRLGQELYSVPVGLLAAAIVATRVPLLNFGIRGYVDLPTIALIVWAAVLEARRPRRGTAVMVLLTLAGLLRPEIWLFAAVYWLWCARELDTRGRVRLGLLAALAPVLWALTDLAITGNPFWSLHGTTDLAAELGRRTGIGAVPEIMPRRLGEILRLPELLAAVIGFAAGLVYLRRRTLLPAAIAVLNGVAFVIFGIAGLSLLGRYLFLASTMLALFAALAALGWTALERGPSRAPALDGGRGGRAAGDARVPARRRPGGSATCAPTSPTATGSRPTCTRSSMSRPCAARSPSAGRSTCRTTAPCPTSRSGRTRARRTWSRCRADPSEEGVYIGPATPAAEKLSVLDPNDPKPLDAVPLPGSGPAGWSREIARNGSWVAFSAGCDG